MTARSTTRERQPAPLLPSEASTNNQPSLRPRRSFCGALPYLPHCLVASQRHHCEASVPCLPPWHLTASHFIVQSIDPRGTSALWLFAECLRRTYSIDQHPHPLLASSEAPLLHRTCTGHWWYDPRLPKSLFPDNLARPGWSSCIRAPLPRIVRNQVHTCPVLTSAPRLISEYKYPAPRIASPGIANAWA